MTVTFVCLSGVRVMDGDVRELLLDIARQIEAVAEMCEPGMVAVRATCRCVHLGDGRRLWDGERAEVDEDVARLLIARGQARLTV